MLQALQSSLPPDHHRSTLNYRSATLVQSPLTFVQTFGSKETEKIWNGIRVSKLKNEVQEIERRKLRMLNNSQNIADLRIPPSNKLEKLKGDVKDFYSIRINDQWRIVFKWGGGNASKVAITEYH